MIKRIIVALVLTIAAVSYIIAVGDHYTASFYSNQGEVKEGEYSIDLIQDKEVLRIDRSWVEDGAVKIALSSVDDGRAEVDVSFDTGSEYSSIDVLSFVVHKTGVITTGSYFGNCTGGMAIFLAVLFFLAYIALEIVLDLRGSLKENLYSYRNITLVGMLAFLLNSIAYCLLFIFPTKSIAATVAMILNANGFVAFFAIPFAAIITIIVGISNVRLMMKEGVSRNNVLGIVACFLFLAFLVLPRFIDEFLQRTTLIDVHKESGWGNLFNMLIVNILTTVITYLLFILLGTVILTIKTARRRPVYDIDYLIVLGCRIRKDGTLPPLLRGRAEAALEFARTQKEKTGKDVVFIPSGGKGSDEIISEGEAVARYLRESGVSEDHILLEDRSCNTRENFAFSLDLIKERGSEDPKIAFATTNYHVLRSGIIASNLGIKATGIGSKTKWYFWMNAFIRELIATLHHEMKLHVKFLGFILLLVVAMVLFNFLVIFV